MPQSLSQAGGGVCDAGAVHVQEHAAFVGKLGQGLDFGRLVHRSHLRRLGDRDHARLHVMLIVNAMIGMTDSFDRKFAVGDGNGNEFAAGEFLRRAALVRVDVRGFATNYGVISISQRLEAQAIGGSAVENEEDFNVRPEMLLEFLHHGFGVGIVAISHGMTLISFGDGFQDFGMNSGIIVTGKTARRFHDPKQCSRGGRRTSDVGPRP